MPIIYAFVALLATIFGSLAGLGGGVIIKPALDLLGDYDLTTISLLSTFTVFSMAAVATYRQFRTGFKPDKSLYLLAIGAILGGISGKQLFSLLLRHMNDTMASGLQAIILALLLLIVLLRHHLPDYEVKNPIIVLIVGLTLGTLASFLGVGGGPINVAVIMMFLRMDIRKSAVASVFVILLSQLAKILTFTFTTGLSQYNLEMLWFMVPSAIIGGLIGSKLNRVLHDQHLKRIFDGLLIGLILLNIYNAYIFLA